MSDSILQFYPSSPRNDLLDYYLVFQRLEKDILLYKDSESVPSDAKLEFILARREQLKLYGLRAQKIIDWWAKVQAADHKVTIEYGRIIPIRVGKEYGKRISKHKYELKILYEHRRSFLPDTPENRALTSVEGVKSCCGETMVLMSAIDAGRADPAIKEKIKKISEGTGAKFLFLGKALLLVEQALAESKKLIKTCGEKGQAPNSLIRLESDISEFAQYSNYEFVHKDGRARARAHGLATRDANLREIAKVTFQDLLNEQANFSQEQFDDFFSDYDGSEVAISGSDGEGALKPNEKRFKELLADEMRCKVLNDYFVACGMFYPDSYVANAVEKISPIGSLPAARSYVAAHLVARRQAKVELGLIYCIF